MADSEIQVLLLPKSVDDIAVQPKRISNKTIFLAAFGTVALLSVLSYLTAVVPIQNHLNPPRNVSLSGNATVYVNRAATIPSSDKRCGINGGTQTNQYCTDAGECCSQYG
ncbi:hypothetical protein HDV03_002501, partial [Kappamyces sp. JEL0829]